MRITESQLRRIIRQEVRALREGMPPMGGGPITIELDVEGDLGGLSRWARFNGVKMSTMEGGPTGTVVRLTGAVQDIAPPPQSGSGYAPGYLHGDLQSMGYTDRLEAYLV